jgi:serine/threonine-protein kinase RsbW
LTKSPIEHIIKTVFIRFTIPNFNIFNMAKASWQTNQARVSDLQAIRQFVKQKALALGLDADDIYDLALAVTEAVTNIILHGYSESPGPITLTIESREQAVVVQIQDRAAHFDPLRISKPDLTTPLEQRGLGGLGIYLMQNGVDQVKYEAIPQGGNLLTLFKKNQGLPDLA